ncbi:MAG: type 1 glutamine amidotransferase [Magnetococcus sp. YQC-5]
MIKAVIITAKGFQDEEVIYPYYRMLEEGYQVDIATPDGQVVLGKYGVPARATMSTKDLNADRYDLVVLPGGFEAPDRVRLLPEVLEFIREMDLRKKLLAAICHGPWILISAQVVRGRRLTAYWSIEADVRNSGAIYEHKVPVVIDEHVISSPHYDNNGDFMRAIIKYMNDRNL